MLIVGKIFRGYLYVNWLERKIEYLMIDRLLELYRMIAQKKKAAEAE